MRHMIQAALVVIACSVALLAADGPAKVAPPNIVLIVSDDQGYRDLGCFGGTEIKTPNLDRIAKEGVRATSFYVTWPACTPSRGSILTGRFPQRNGLYDMIRNDMVNYGHRYTEEEYAISPEMTLGLDQREVVIAEVLRKAGYACGMVGKWDSGRARRFLPPSRGFDFFYGFANTGIDYWTHERYGVPSMFRGYEPVKDKGYATHLFGREAVQFIRDHKARPFFLYAAFNAPHIASNLEKDFWQVPEEYLRAYPDRDPKDKRTKHMAMVTCMDEQIGKILDALGEAGIDRQTLILFFSDNGGSGPGDNKPLRGGKGTMFEGGIRVPMLARWLGRIPPQTVRDDFLTSLEVFPTLCTAAGAAAPPGVTLDGFDMMAVLEGKAASPRKEMFWERRREKAARVGRYKWVDCDKGKGLFDLSTDIAEEHDLSEQKPEVLKELQERFSAWKKEMEAADPRGPFRNY